MDRILIIEDDRAIAMAIEDDLTFEEYAVSVAFDGMEGLRQALSDEFALIILDVLLPRLNGFEVCRKLREGGVDTPILMLTAARTEEMDKVLGLELGADDYVTKPVGSRELVARVKAILRRTQPQDTPVECYAFGDICVDLRTYEVMKAGKPLHLTPMEFGLLKLFIQHRGEVLTRDVMLNEAWGDAIVTDRTINTHIAHLRQKIEKDPANPEYIVAIRGVGYRFDG